jgi:hypothetical protein
VVVFIGGKGKVLNDNLIFLSTILPLPVEGVDFAQQKAG